MFYKQRRNRLIWLLIIFIPIALYNYSFLKKTSSLIVFSRTLAINMVYPFQYVAKASYNGISSFFVDIISLRAAQAENEKFKKELMLYKARTNSYDEAIKDNERLKQVLNYKLYSPFSYRLIPAEIISRSASNWFSEIEINKGTEDQIKKDMAVIASDGLVGKVIEVSRYSSKVLLITDPFSSVSAVNQKSRDLGIAIGGAIGPIQMKYVSTNADIKVDDTIVTSGMSEIFPRGIVIGKVKSVNKKDYDLFQRITLSPAVNFSRLESVFIIFK